MQAEAPEGWCSAWISPFERFLIYAPNKDATRCPRADQLIAEILENRLVGHYLRITRGTSRSDLTIDPFEQLGLRGQATVGVTHTVDFIDKFHELVKRQPPNPEVCVFLHVVGNHIHILYRFCALHNNVHTLGLRKKYVFPCFVAVCDCREMAYPVSNFDLRTL